MFIIYDKNRYLQPPEDDNKVDSGGVLNTFLPSYGVGLKRVLSWSTRLPRASHSLSIKGVSLNITGKHFYEVGIPIIVLDSQLSVKMILNNISQFAGLGG